MTASISSFKPLLPPVLPVIKTGVNSPATPSRFGKAQSGLALNEAGTVSQGASSNSTLIAQRHNPAVMGNKDTGKGEVQGIGPDGRVYKTMLIQRTYNQNTGPTPALFFANGKRLPSNITAVAQAKDYVRQQISQGTLGRLDLGDQLAFPIKSVPPVYAPKAKDGDIPSFGRFESIGSGRQVAIGARTDTSLFMDLPRQAYPSGEGRRIALPGVTTKSTPQDITKAIKRLTNNPDLVAFVYSTEKNKRAIYNHGGNERVKAPQFETATSPEGARKGLRRVWAHAGDREAMPGMPRATGDNAKMADFPEAAWENSLEALKSAARKGAGLEMDFRLNEIDGKGYLSHDHFNKRVDRFGKEDPAAIDIKTGRPEDVQQVATPFTRVLSEFNRVAYPDSAMIVELKKDTSAVPPIPMSWGYAKKAALALYTELKMHDRHKDVNVSSMEPDMLLEIDKLGRADGVKMNLIYVLPFTKQLTRDEVDWVKNKLPNVKSIAFTTDSKDVPYVDLYGVITRKAPQSVKVGTTKEQVDYAKSRELKVIGWNWDPTPKTTQVGDSTKRANELGLDEMITDSITNLWESNPNWK